MKGQVRRANTNCRPTLLTNPALRPVIGINRRETEQHFFVFLKLLWLPGLLFFHIFMNIYVLSLYPKLGNQPQGCCWLSCFGVTLQADWRVTVLHTALAVGQSCRDPFCSAEGAVLATCLTVKVGHCQPFSSQLFVKIIFFWFAKQCKPYTE